MHQEVINGDCLEVMRGMAENSIDFVVTDPPYGLHFMGKDWDDFKKSNFDERGDYKYLENSSVDGRNCKVRKIGCANHKSGSYDSKCDDEFQAFMHLVGIEILRIIKPGGHVAMFGSTRRHHRQMCALEDAGFEIRDCMMWLFGQGFPKSHNFGRKMGNGWEGYGTTLKPAYEPIILAMKPLEGTFAQNAEKWGVAGLNIDKSRIGSHEYSQEEGSKKGLSRITGNSFGEHKPSDNPLPKGRWPSSLLLDEEAAEQLDRMSGITTSQPDYRDNLKKTKYIYNSGFKRKPNYLNDSGGASRFFYCAKTSSAERNKGLEEMELKPGGSTVKGYTQDISKGIDRNKPVANHHPTVKPISLMKYIIKLLAPPGNPVCLDPFAGSGSTLVAAKELGIACIGIEKQPNYCDIARARVAAVEIEPEQLEMFG